MAPHISDDKEIVGDCKEAEDRNRGHKAALWPEMVPRLRLRTHGLPPDMQRVTDVLAERLAQFAQQITFKKIHEIVAATPVQHLPSPDDETVLVVACDEGRPLKAVVGIVVRAINLPAIEYISYTLGRTVPVFNRGIRRVHRPCTMAMLVAFPASAKTAFIALWHG